MKPRLCIAIVNYHSSALLSSCLDALASVDAPQLTTEILIADNCSNAAERTLLDDLLAARPQANLRAVYFEENRGLAAAINRLYCEELLAGSPPEYLALLNPDAEITLAALAKLVAELDTDPTLGIVAPQLTFADGQPRRPQDNFPTPLGEYFRAARRHRPCWLNFRGNAAHRGSKSGEAAWVPFSCAVIRSEAFERVGLLDESYFLYYEDVDFCRRARRAGWHVRVLPSAVGCHLGGGSSGIRSSSACSVRLPAYWHAARKRYFRKHFGAGGALLADCCWIAGALRYRIYCLVKRRQLDDPPHLLGDALRYCLTPRRLLQALRTAPGR